MRQRKVRIARNRLLKVTDCQYNALLRGSSQGVLAIGVQQIGRGVFRATQGMQCRVGSGKWHRESLGHSGRYLLLDARDAGDISIELVGPQLPAVGDTQQSHRHAQLVAVVLQ